MTVQGVLEPGTPRRLVGMIVLVLPPVASAGLPEVMARGVGEQDARRRERIGSIQVFPMSNPYLRRDIPKELLERVHPRDGYQEIG